MTLPSSWSLQRLDSIASLSRGKFSARPRNDPRFFGGDIPFVQTGDVRNAHVFLRDFTQTLNWEGLKVSRVFPQGTMLFTIAANIGDLAFLSFDAACPDSLVAIEPKQGTDAVWLFYQLGAFKADFEAAATQNAQLNINLEKLNPFNIPVPPLHEQQAIAAALSDADGVVAGLERVIAKKRLIKQGAMQDLLTARRRLPGFSGEWEVKRLGELGVCLRGVSYDGSADLFESATLESIMLLRANNVQNGEVVYSDVQHVRKERVKPVQHLRRGDVLICMANGSRTLVGKAGVFWEDQGAPLTFGAFMGCFRPVIGAAADGFVPFLFQSDTYRNQLNVILSGSAINNLSPGQILNFSFKMPVDPIEQQAIAAVLSDMDAEIQTLESRLTKARAVKEGMMQNLLTGRVRLV